MNTNEVWPPAPRMPVQVLSPRIPLTETEIFWGIVGRMTWMGLLRGAILGASFGVFFWIIGAIFGLFIGGAAGLVLGFLDGLILGAVTCGCFQPWERQKGYQITLCVLGSLVAFLGSIGIVWLYFGPQWSGDNGAWIFGSLPILIATAAAGEAGLRVAKWCAKVS